MELKNVRDVVSRLKSNSKDKDQMEAMESVLALIDKQVAIIPDVNRQGELVCPTCNRPLHPVKWCDCGQLIDWSEDGVETPTEIVHIRAISHVA